MCSLTESILYRRSIRGLTDSKNTSACLSRFPDKTQRIILRCHFTALYIFTQKLIHTKCPTLLKGTSKNAVIRGPVWSTVKEHSAFYSLSLHPSVLVSVWWREMAREMSGAAEGSQLCCVWAVEPLVTGHCQVGSPAGPACGLTRNAVVLSVVKEL